MITLRIRLDVAAGQGPALEQLYAEAYVPAIRGQRGFRRCELWRQHGDPARYEIAIYFDSEDLRLQWVASAEHAASWPRIEALCSTIAGQGFDAVVPAVTVES